MRVLILRHGYFPRDPRVRRETGTLIARGHDVEVICLRQPGEPAREVCDGAAVTRLPIAHRRAGIARYLGEYGAFFAGALVLTSWRHLRHRYDVVQVNTMPDALVFAAVVPKVMGARLLLDLHEAMPELYAAKFGVALDHPVPRILGRLEQAAIRFADACLAVSEPCLARYVARGADRDAFTVVMNAPDPALFGGISSPATADPPTLISHGTLVERYGFDLIIRALVEVPGARLEILGDGEARPALERLAADLGVAERVTFAGFVPLEAIPHRIAAADVGVVANRRDPFTDLVLPTKLLEFMAVGVPTVAARAPAIAAHFDDRAVAFFEAGDAADLARVLRAVLAEPARRAALARQARAQLAGYQWPVMAERYVALVERLRTGALGREDRH